DERALAGAQRDLREQPGDRVQRLGLAAVGALRRAGRPAREDDEAALVVGRDDVAAVARVDELLERRGAAGAAVSPVRPGEEALAPLQRAGEQPGELLVVDDRRGRLVGADLRELRPGERRVEKERVRPELRAGDRRLDEPA